MRALSLLWAVSMGLLVPADSFGQSITPLAPRREALVIGAMHLRQRDANAPAINVEAVRRVLMQYRPDQVAIEWLHPSIDPASTFNYRPLGDRATLARLWGYSLERLGATTDSSRGALSRASAGPARASLRRELGRLYYLGRDEANAAFQWFRARQEGAPDPEAERLVVRLLGGHEGVEWGFAAAAASGLEHITAFDYQGPDAGTLVWGEMLDALRDSAIVAVDHVAPKDSAAWKRATTVYDSLRRAFEDRQDGAWPVRYARAPGVAQYAAVIRGFAAAQAKEPPEQDGLTLIRWLQSAEYEAVERHTQLELIPSIRFGGFGERRRAGIAERNRQMVDFLVQDADRSGARRVLVIVGAQHKFEIEDILRRRGFTIVESRSVFKPRQ